MSGPAYIPTCRSPSLLAVASLSHGPRNCPASLSYLANDRPMHYRLFIFGVGLTPGPKFTKGEMTWWTPRSTILQNFIALRQPTPEISVTKNPADRKTSTPVARTGVIPTCRSPSPPMVGSLSHGPRNCPASLSHLAKDRPMHYRLFIFGLGANPSAKVHQMGR